MVSTYRGKVLETLNSLSEGVQLIGSPVVSKVVTIPNGGSLSAAINLGANLAVIYMPDAWTPAVMTFMISADEGVTWHDFRDENDNEYTMTVRAGAAHKVPQLADWLGNRWVKFRSGTSAAPVNQAADRTLTLQLVP